MIIARRKEQEFFATSPEYSHLANRMGSEYLAKLLSQVQVNLSIVFVFSVCKFAMVGHALLFPSLST